MMYSTQRLRTSAGVGWVLWSLVGCGVTDLDEPSGYSALHDACEMDSDCHGIGARCELEHGVCLMRCPSVVLKTSSDLAAAHHCHEIDGDLTLDSTDLTRVGADALPYLERVTGSLRAAVPSRLIEITLPALREVGTDARSDLVRIGFDLQSLRRVSLPMLGVVHGRLVIAVSDTLEALHLNSLVATDGGLALAGLPRLTTLELPDRVRVGGSVLIERLCRLPYSRLPSDLTTSDEAPPRVLSIGCCTQSSSECGAADCGCD